MFDSRWAKRAEDISGASEADECGLMKLPERDSSPEEENDIDLSILNYFTGKNVGSRGREG